MDPCLGQKRSDGIAGLSTPLGPAFQGLILDFKIGPLLRSDT